MIDSEGRLLCDSCLAGQNHSVMGKVGQRELVIYGKHHGERHVLVMPLFDLLPPPGSQEYSDLVAELVKRLPTI